MSNITKPMKACDVELSKLVFPLYLSFKRDGIRGLKVDDKFLSRTFKPIPNKYIRNFIEQNLPNEIDGELLCGATFNDTQSAVMTIEGEPNFTYHLFDYVKYDCNTVFNNRYVDLLVMHSKLPEIVKNRVFVVRQYLVNNLEEVLVLEKEAIEQGFEGIVLRSITGIYKKGRSTVKEGYLLRYKRFYDAEAEIVGFIELMHNANEAEKDAFGRTKRSTKKAGLVPAGILGEFRLKDTQTGAIFGCGTGLLEDQRKRIWANQSDYMGKIVTYTYQQAGKKYLPRFPVFKGFRHKDDLGE
jgi:DNA ligase-1